MSRTFAATLRRAGKLMKPARRTRIVRSLQSAVAGLMITSALAPMGAIKPKRAKKAAATVTRPARTLGAVLRRLRAAQSLLPGAAGEKPAPSPRIPAGARYTAATHRSTAGSCAYRLYLPASQPQRPKGLIVMLHGCNQTPDDFALGTHMNTVAEKHGLAVAYPAQSAAQNAAACWNWFKPAHQARGAGEPAILASLTRTLARKFGLGRAQVYVAGLSAGGSMAAILADVYPDVFSAAGVHSGLARGAADTVLSALAAMQTGGKPGAAAPADKGNTVRRIIFHGGADATVHPSNAAQIVAAAVGADAVAARTTSRSVRGRDYVRRDFSGPDGVVQLELWMLKGAGHAWSGGRAAGSYTDRKGPDASAQMIRFFLTDSVAAAQAIPGRPRSRA